VRSHIDIWSWCQRVFRGNGIVSDQDETAEHLDALLAIGQAGGDNFWADDGHDEASEGGSSIEIVAERVETSVELPEVPLDDEAIIAEDGLAILDGAMQDLEPLQDGATLLLIGGVGSMSLRLPTER
jgi:hypothetical protein